MYKSKYFLMRIVSVSYAILLLLSLYGCHNETSVMLEKADRLIQENPDSALSIMEEINPDNLSDEGEKAFYALLLTEALYRTGIDQTDDSIINISTTYYHLKENNPLRARAYYQKGMIQNNAGEYSNAFLSLMLAEETASASQDTRQLALIHRSMADIFESINNPKTAVDYYTRSYEEFSAVNDSVYANDALFDMARANHNAINYQEAINTLRILLPRIEAAEDRQLIPYILDLMGSTYQALEQYDEAISVLTRLHNEYPSMMKPSAWNNLGLSYLMSGNLEKARECEDSIKALIDEPSWLSYRIADVSGNYPKALSLLKVEYQDGNNFFIDWVSRSAEKDLLDQYARLKENMRLEKRTNATIFALVFVSIVLLAIIAYLIIKRLRRRNRKLTDDNARLAENNVTLTGQRETLTEQLNVNKEVIRNLREDISRQNNEIISLRANLHSLIDKKEKLTKDLEFIADQNSRLTLRITEADSILAAREEAISEARIKLKEAVASQSLLIDGMVKAYYDSDSKKLPKNEVLDKFCGIIKGLRHDNELILQFEKLVNSHLDNLMVSFKSDYPNLNDYEYDLFLFSVLGFSTKSISVFQDISAENFYNRKSKLIKKIKNVEASVNPGKYLDYI